jgi:hypothetical protein
MDSLSDNNEDTPELPEEAARPEELGQPEEVSKPEEVEEQPAAAAPEGKPHRPSAEDALAAMRADLRDDESKGEAGRRGVRGLIQRLFHRRKAAPQEDVEVPSRLDELQFPPPPPRITSKPEPERTAAEAKPPEAAPAESKPDFQAMVRDRLTEAWSATVQREPLEMQPPAPVEEEVEHPAHSILTTLRQEPSEVAPEPVDIRQTALEDYVVAPEQPEEERQGSFARRLKTSWRYMRPTEKRLLISALVIIALAALGGSGYLAYQSIPTPTAVVTPTIRVEPIPISVSLPGGWVFPLNVGYVDNGKWNPRGAEWLNGTELCRWVSLPWTVQLEAVLRTMKADDEIQLSMSNYDSIVYKVKSIEQVPSSSINKLASDSPCLLLILSRDDSDNRWVVTAKP